MSASELLDKYFKSPITYPSRELCRQASNSESLWFEIEGRTYEQEVAVAARAYLKAGRTELGIARAKKALLYYKMIEDVSKICGFRFPLFPQDINNPKTWGIVKPDAVKWVDSLNINSA